MNRGALLYGNSDWCDIPSWRRDDSGGSLVGDRGSIEADQESAWVQFKRRYWTTSWVTAAGVIVTALAGIISVAYLIPENRALDRELTTTKSDLDKAQLSLATTQRKLDEQLEANKLVSSQLASLREVEVTKVAGQFGRIVYESFGRVWLDENSMAHLDQAEPTVAKAGWTVNITPMHITQKYFQFEVFMKVYERRVLGRDNEYFVPIQRSEVLSVARCLDNNHGVLLIITDVRWGEFDYAIVGVEAPEPECARPTEPPPLPQK
jgi:hypothetical protein